MPVLLVLVALAVVLTAGGLTAVVLMRGGDTDPAPPRDTSNEEIARLQEQFKRYIENQLDFTNLLPEVKAYTRDHPDSVAGHVLLAQVLMRLEQYAQAYPALTQALEGNPDNFELLKLTGACAAKLERWDEAERYLTEADALKEDQTVVLQLGNVFFQTGRLDAAEEAFTRAKAIRSESPPHKANAGLAEVHAGRGDYARALTMITLAIKWAGGDSEADISAYKLKKVRILFDAGRWDEGAQLLRVTMQEHPGVVYTLPSARLRARLAEQRGDLSGAAGEIGLLASGVVAAEDQTDRERADIYAELAHWQLKAGDTAGAADSVQALRDLMPSHARLAELEAQLAP